MGEPIHLRVYCRMCDSLWCVDSYEEIYKIPYTMNKHGKYYKCCDHCRERSRINRLRKKVQICEDCQQRELGIDG